MSADPPRFAILSEWMSNGDVMGYTKLNPEANRLRLVNHLPFLLLSIHKKFSSPIPHLGWPTFTNSASSMETSKA